MIRRMPLEDTAAGSDAVDLVLEHVELAGATNGRDIHMNSGSVYKVVTFAFESMGTRFWAPKICMSGDISLNFVLK